MSVIKWLHHKRLSPIVLVTRCDRPDLGIQRIFKDFFNKNGPEHPSRAFTVQIRYKSLKRIQQCEIEEFTHISWVSWKQNLIPSSGTNTGESPECWMICTQTVCKSFLSSNMLHFWKNSDYLLEGPLLSNCLRLQRLASRM